MGVLGKFQANLADPVAPGGGCHGWIMSTANLGIMAGLSGDVVFEKIRQAIPAGSRRVPDREIQDAIRKAAQDHTGGTFAPTKPKPVIPAAVTFESVAQGKYSTEAELIASSPIPIPAEPEAQQKLFFETMFARNDFVFCADRLQPGTSSTIRPACEWTLTGAPGPFIIVNPLSGLPAEKKSGDGSTYRGDGCVKTFRHALVEFDDRTIAEQIMFWSAAKLPIKCLIHTAGKSIHAWLDLSKLNIITTQQWGKIIKVDLYERRLKPLGVDMQCSNAARLSRVPGVFRQEKKQWQRLLWLSAEGRNVC